MSDTDHLPEPELTRPVTSLPLEEVGRIALILAPVVLAIFIIPFVVGLGLRALAEPFTQVWFYVLCAPVFLISIVLHEGLHALAFMLLGRPGPGAIQFGFERRSLTPYVHVTAPVKAWVYRIGLLLPGLALGVIPALVSIWLGLGWLLLYGASMSLAALGDLLAYWALKGVPGQVLVRDHPEEVGCLVLWDAETTTTVQENTI